MKIIYTLVLYFNIYNVISCVSIDHTEMVDDKMEAWQTEMDTIIYKTINKYQCTIDHMSGITLIMYGTNAWTFPIQDVNLTLRFPSSNTDPNTEWNDYVISGFEVILYIDGLGSNGFITEGGILQETVTLTFTSSQITQFRYQFWVYGIKKEGRFLAVNNRLNCYERNT